ncbi:MAG: hypothetical protein A2X35_01550 [Elusimicrobia bacterium GWA2_61_42]|nr:MAG: hypothetical protein A2X35_01550 [Elusimicrobia bacterium GWA2_61_42]OGR76832.1 MAG: hypothetical protein A2X38_11725 [Elusimicrobia bacterium GWC2_61_25]
MKITGLLLLCCLPLCLSAAAEKGWTVKMTAVNGAVSYSHAQASPIDEQTSYSGKTRVRGRGPAREIIFNSVLNRTEDGRFRLDYQAELSGENLARPPFQAAGKVLLRPGKPVLAAKAGGWKLILELQGKAEGESPAIETATLETRLKCGRQSYPVDFAYLPDQQYSAVLYEGSDDTVRKFMLGLLPNSSALDGAFRLQYTLLLKDGGETLASGQGELILAPGEGKQSASAGKNCVFTAKALN